MPLRGVNKYGFENYPAGGPWGDTYLHYYENPWGGGWNTTEGREAVAKVLDAMKSWGVNCVRMPQAIDHWKLNIGNHRQIIKELLTMMNDRGMALIYCPFKITGSDAGGVGGVLPYPPYAPSVQGVIESPQDYVSFWGQLAQEMKSYSNLIYNFWNEPQAGGWDDYLTGPGFDSWKTVNQQCIDAIRGAGGNQPIIIEWWSGTTTNLSVAPDVSNTRGLDWALSFPLNDPRNNLIWSIHVYRSWGSFYSLIEGLQYGSYTEADIAEAFSRFKVDEVKQQLGQVIIGEIGCHLDNDSTNELKAFEECLKLFNKNGWNYCAWWFSDEGPFRLHEGESTLFNPTDSGVILKEYLKQTPLPPPPTGRALTLAIGILALAGIVYFAGGEK